ncbi:Uncharacterised protein [Bordetella pertussis]|nr:Uncharacterised protein [Bordetella pertussis]CFN77905.1 Uncharacterised protein [Bordetella pertussis]CFO38070.1 Uncharacterised protein [Bordetella pertussis]CFP10152.1 Uncharacterised protein [Bordetella pertussis]CPK47691.1 Uncharacterised protein [Bordetella pertussis]
MPAVMPLRSNSPPMKMNMGTAVSVKVLVLLQARSASSDSCGRDSRKYTPNRPTRPNATPMRTPRNSSSIMLATSRKATQPSDCPRARPYRTAQPPTTSTTCARVRTPLHAHAQASRAATMRAMPQSKRPPAAIGTALAPRATSAAASKASSAGVSQRRQAWAGGLRR